MGSPPGDFKSPASAISPPERLWEYATFGLSTPGSCQGGPVFAIFGPDLGDFDREVDTMEDRKHDQALEDAMRETIAAHTRRAEEPPPPPPPRRAVLRIALILAGWATIGWIWLARPAAIFGPTQAGEVPVAEREARLRFAVYLRHEDLVAFRNDSGRLPHSLDELGAEDPEGVTLTYDPEGAWTLEGTDQELKVRLVERMSADSFLGRSLDLLRQAP